MTAYRAPRGDHASPSRSRRRPISAAAPTTAIDPAYPAKPIRVIVGFPPGGGNDEIARIVGPKLAEKSGRSVVIDNRPGAGGNLAAELTAKAPADGYTILVISSSHPIQGLLKKNLPYDPVRDFAGVAELVVYRSLLVTFPGVPANSVADLLALAKAKPGQVNFVSSGNGSASHLAGELFKVSAQVEHHARSVQGQLAGADRPDRRPRANDVQSAGAGVAAHQDESPAPARRDEPRALAPAARAADDQRGRRSGL